MVLVYVVHVLMELKSQQPTEMNALHVQMAQTQLNMEAQASHSVKTRICERESLINFFWPQVV